MKKDTKNKLLDSFQEAKKFAIPVLFAFAIMLMFVFYGIYNYFRIDVPAYHLAVLTKKTGLDLENNQSMAPDDQYKGVQLNILTEGRYFYNGFMWDWSVYPMIEIPSGKLGVRTRLYGNNLPYGHFLATKDTEKGVIPEVLRPGRYPLNAIIKGEKNRSKNDYAEVIEIYDPIIIPAGFRGVVTNLAGPLAENPNVLLVENDFRGVQKEALEAGTYYLNPYLYSVHIIDCRSQRFNLAETNDMGFPSLDGFWITLDGIIEFRIQSDKVSQVYVVYNSNENDTNSISTVNDEIVQKIIMPNARSFCRIRGSNSKGKDFIGGDTRTAFQKEFFKAMKDACEKEGIDIVQALITKINPPQAIAAPIREAEISRQRLYQYKEQNKQQIAEANLAIEKALVDQRKELVRADQDVVKKITTAKEDQQVKITLANQRKAVAERDLDTAKDDALAILSVSKAKSQVIIADNIAEASGWKKSVESFGGDGMAFAKYVLNQKMAPSFQQIMINTADSPLMEMFRFKKEIGK